MKKLFTILVAAAFAANASAQQEALFTSPLTASALKNPILFNPGAVGASNDAQLRIYHRWQWVGFPGAPITLGASYHTGYGASGFGANLMLDQTGPTSRLTGELSYAYHLQVADNARFAVGVKGRYLGYQLRTNDIHFNDGQDPIANLGTYNSSKFDAGAGLYFHSPRLRAGVAVDNLIQARKDILPETRNDAARYYRHLYAVAAYDIKLKEVTLTPCAMMRTTFQTEPQFEGGLHAQFEEHDFGIGAAYRTPGFLSFSFNTLFDKKLPLVISFDVATTQFSQYSSFAYELNAGADWRRNDIGTNYMVSKKSK